MCNERLIVIELWDGQLDLRPLVEQWVSEIPGDYDIDKCMEDVRKLNESKGSAVLVLMVDGKPVGGLAITILDMFFTQESYAAVRYWYLLPRHRWMAKTLITAAKQWASGKGCDKIMVCSSKLSHPAKDFYTSMGFTEFETVYIGDV